MGSNMYGGEQLGNCNGAHAQIQHKGVIMSGHFIGKDQPSNSLSHFNSIVTVDEDGLSPLQNSTTTSSSTSSPPSTSPAPHNNPSSNCTGTDNPGEVAQVKDGSVNGYAQNCSSMDRHPAGSRNLTNAEAQMLDQAHIISQQLQQHPLPLPGHPPLVPHIYPASSSTHPASLPNLTLSSAVAMGLVDHVGFPLVDSSQIFRAPPVGGFAVPSHYSHSLGNPGEGVGGVGGRPDNSSPAEGGKVVGKRRTRKRQKNCGVCGDRAKSFHFGGLSCDSCKAFFRRSVQNDAYLAFRCAYDNICEITISTRKSCQYCRFAKCLSIGMEKTWVMTEEERNQLNQQRLEKKHSKTAPATVTSATMTQPPPPVPPPQLPIPQPLPEPRIIPETATSSSRNSPDPTYNFASSSIPPTPTPNDPPPALAFQESEYVCDVEKMLDYMSYEEQTEIKSVVETYLHAYKEMPFRVPFEEGARKTLEIIDMFTTILRRFVYFAKLIPDFAALCKEDQTALLRTAVLEMCLLRGAVCYDTETNRWPSSTMESLRNCPQLRVEDMQRLVSSELFNLHIAFILQMKRLRIDEPTAMLLIMTVLFSPENNIKIVDRATINLAQEKYLLLLRKYVDWKFGLAAGSRVYPQLLTKLSDLRQLNDFHTEFHLLLDQQEVHAIRQSMEQLHINPYPNWKIVPESQNSSPEESPQTTPTFPAPSSSNSPSMPMVSQALIRSFTDRRIPTLLDNPHATFETDLGMLKHVQQTLGSLFPTSAQAAFTTANTQNKLMQQFQGSESEGGGNPSFSRHDPMLSSEKAGCSTSTSMSSRGYANSSDSADVQPMEFLYSSRSQEYSVLNFRDSMTLPTSTLSESSLTSLLPGEYHSERLQQFLQQSRSSSGFETGEGVIRGVGAASTTSSTSSPTTPSSTSSFALIPGSQLPTTPPTVLRKHSSSSRSSLPAAPIVSSSVIRSAPPASKSGITVSSIVHSSAIGVIQTITDDSNRKDNPGGSPFRSISTAGVGAGWHGGQVQATTTNGHPPPANPSPITITSRIKSTIKYSDANDQEVSSFKKKK